VMIICAGVGFQLLQLAYSIWKRDELRDYTGDPWNARTLEWSTPTPVPEYNFAILPEVTGRDAFWEAKQAAKKAKSAGVAAPATPVYEAIKVPKNSADSIYIALAAFLAGFGLIWHIWWLALLAVLALVLVVILHGTSEDDGERTISKSEVAKIEAAWQEVKAQA